MFPEELIVVGKQSLAPSGISLFVSIWSLFDHRLYFHGYEVWKECSLALQILPKDAVYLTSPRVSLSVS